MRAIIDSAIPYLRGVLEPYAEVIYREGSKFERSEVRDADLLIIRTRTRCNSQLLEGSRVRLIATATIGFDHIDLEYCQSHNIKVVTAQGCNAAGVLQWVAAALALLSQEDGWQPSERTLGVVGVGNVGSLIERYARSWGFRVLRCDPPRAEREGGDFLSMEQVVEGSDIVTFHTPLDSSTHHLIDEKLLSLLRSDAVLINASRGEVASTEALLNAPQRLMLDVWEGEPNIDSALLEKALVATPHIAGYSAQGKANASAAVIEAAAQFFSLPIQGWYPSEVKPVERCEIGWEQMRDSIVNYCDLRGESLLLKSSPSGFEQMRNGYAYREEYF